MIKIFNGSFFCKRKKKNNNAFYAAGGADGFTVCKSP
jgi:hypothetical protein